MGAFVAHDFGSSIKYAAIGANRADSKPGLYHLQGVDAALSDGTGQSANQDALSCKQKKMG